MTEFTTESLNYCINTRRKGNSSIVQTISGTRHSEKLQMLACRSAEIIFELHAVVLLTVGMHIFYQMQLNNYLIF
jgi:hypothetical protein